MDTINNTMLLYADDISVVITEYSATATRSQASSLLEDINSWFRNNLNWLWKETSGRGMFMCTDVKCGEFF
jgi:hypothetical protein